MTNSDVFVAVDLSIFMPPHRKIGDILFHWCQCVCLCLCPKPTFKNFTCSSFFQTNLVTRPIFGMKAHLIDTHLLVQRSRSSAEVKVKYQGHISLKIAFSGALMIHKHVLFSRQFLSICFIW